MKSAVLACVLLAFTIQAPASTEVRNGGGGTRVGGKPATFHSAQVALEATAEMASSLPGLPQLVKGLDSLHLSEMDKGRVIRAVYPVGSRKYYRIEDDEFGTKFKADLIKKYSELTGIPAEDIVIFAATNPETAETVLLPEFYQLNRFEQAAIILHEAMWVLNPKASYMQVVRTEAAMQAYLEHPHGKGAFYHILFELSQVLGRKELPLVPSLERDIQDRVMACSHKRVLVSDLFGRGMLNAFLRTPPMQNEDSRLPYAQEQAVVSFSEALNRAFARPQSMFLKAFSDYLQQGGAVFISAYLGDHHHPEGYKSVWEVRDMPAREYENYINSLYVDVNPQKRDPYVFNLVRASGQLAGTVTFY